jgi:hypothetical protein
MSFFKAHQAGPGQAQMQKLEGQLAEEKVKKKVSAGREGEKGRCGE